jgi:hypothetical protein
MRRVRPMRTSLRLVRAPGSVWRPGRRRWRRRTTQIGLGLLGSAESPKPVGPVAAELMAVVAAGLEAVAAALAWRAARVQLLAWVQLWVQLPV